MAQSGNEWKKCNTLGSKAKVFCWKIDEKRSIWIKRQFKSKIHPSGEVTDERSLTIKQLEENHRYVQSNNGNGGTDLANNVQKLGNGTEKDGLGKFMFNLFGGKDPNYGQLASHIASLFVESGAWTKNNAQRGMKFKTSTEDWQNCLISLYDRSPDCTMTN